MSKMKKSSTLVSTIPVTWAAIIFDGKPFSSIPESEVEDFKNWYPRGGWMPDRKQGRTFYRTGIPFITHNKRQDVVEVVFERKRRVRVPDLSKLLSDEDVKEILLSVSHVKDGPKLEDIQTDAFKFHMEVNK